MPKLLVTGSNGFVGSHIVEDALAQGYSVYAGVRKSSNLQYLQDPRINFVYYNFENEDNLREQLSSHHFDYIVLNAGVTNAPNKETYFKINAGYIRKICRILIEENVIPKKLVLISSLASYGPADRQLNQILDQNATPHPVTWYGESKLQAEQFVQSFKKIPSIILRPTAVYGPRDVDMVEVYKTIKKGIEPIIGKGEQLQTFIYIKDLSRLVIHTLSSSVRNKAYFVSDGIPYPHNELNNLLKSKLDKKTISIRIPIPAMKAIAAVSEWTGKLKGEFPLLNKNKVKEYFARSFAVDITELKNDFNFAPQYNLSQGLDITLDWCIKNKLL